MKRCYNCKYLRVWCGGDIYICDLIDHNAEIKHPFFQGGPKKCECYEPIPPEPPFIYPKKQK